MKEVKSKIDNFCSKTGQKLHKVCPNCWIKGNRAYDCGFKTCPGLKLHILEVSIGSLVEY